MKKFIVKQTIEATAITEWYFVIKAKTKEEALDYYDENQSTLVPELELHELLEDGEFLEPVLIDQIPKWTSYNQITHVKADED